MEKWYKCRKEGEWRGRIRIQDGVSIHFPNWPDRSQELNINTNGAHNIQIGWWVEDPMLSMLMVEDGL
jgi:hypothetical protein